MHLFLFLLLFAPLPAMALEPGEIAVIANTRSSESQALARYYLQKRDIPKDNLVGVTCSLEESITRQDYDDTIRLPVRRALDHLRKKQRIRCLVLLYGMPLKIQEALPNGEHPKAGRPAALKENHAAVDSELALVLNDDYPLEGWLPNPYYIPLQGKKTLLHKDRVLMTARLDGPDPATVRRLIDDALAVQGILRGNACIDARWPPPSAHKDRPVNGYALYDASLHHLAGILQRDGRLPVRLDQSETLFAEGDCPDTALYCGWYSLARYRDAFTWMPGAVAYHIASGEATTLRQRDSQVWCKRMLEDGVAATIGPVHEPYVQGFPPPDLFFAQLLEGYLSLAECYLTSLPFLSWQMVLIGDPLYYPFSPPVSADGNKSFESRAKRQ